MRIEQEVPQVMRLDVKSHAPSDDGIRSELDVFPQPTIDQLDEMLEERILSDRRKTNHDDGCNIERRAFQRRQSD